jgi:hypothetical protein
MRYLKIISVLCITFIIIISCNDKSTDTVEKEVKATLYQLPGCPSHSGSLNKVSTWGDSCFTYTFKDTLKIDFCLYGNCSPDHDRFDLSYHISSDTIYVAAKDTAKNIANCMCTYTIHAEFENLNLDHYVFNCKNYFNKYNEGISKAQNN